MVGSNINNPNSDAMFNNAQRRYSAGPRLDRARDASLEHQRSHGVTQNTTRGDGGALKSEPDHQKSR